MNLSGKNSHLKICKGSDSNSTSTYEARITQCFSADISYFLIQVPVVKSVLSKIFSI